MGGYAAPVNLIGGYDPSYKSSLATPALTWLLSVAPELVPDLTVEEIGDKSKASSLAKAIVCGEALWFCIQCIARFVIGLSVTLLELNVLGHALCALVIYWLWWDKPLDIDQSTIMDHAAMKDILPLLEVVPGQLPFEFPDSVTHRWTCPWTCEPYYPGTVSGLSSQSEVDPVDSGPTLSLQSPTEPGFDR